MESKLLPKPKGNRFSMDNLSYFIAILGAFSLVALLHVPVLVQRISMVAILLAVLSIILEITINAGNKEVTNLTNRGLFVAQTILAIVFTLLIERSRRSWDSFDTIMYCTIFLYFTVYAYLVFTPKERSKASVGVFIMNVLNVLAWLLLMPRDSKGEENVE